MRTKEFAPEILPLAWKKLNPRTFLPVGHPLRDAHDMRWYAKNDGLNVIMTVSAKNDLGDDRSWMHVSCSRANRVPDYEDLCEVKRIFVGQNRRALHIFPDEKYHVNIHPFTLHLWCAIEGDGLPEFGEDGTI